MTCSAGGAAGMDWDAVNNLAVLLLLGAHGAPRDPQRAVQLLLAAVERGAHAMAHCNLALCVLMAAQLGGGVLERDRARAMQLLEHVIVHTPVTGIDHSGTAATAATAAHASAELASATSSSPR